MSSNELEGQQREIFGLDAVHCRICNAAIPAGEAIDIESESGLAEHDESVLICPGCWRRVREGELDLKAALLADTEEGLPPDA